MRFNLLGMLSKIIAGLWLVRENTYQVQKILFKYISVAHRVDTHHPAPAACCYLSNCLTTVTRLPIFSLSPKLKLMIVSASCSCLFTNVVNYLWYCVTYTCTFLPFSHMWIPDLCATKEAYLVFGDLVIGDWWWSFVYLYLPCEIQMSAFLLVK